ncbi:XRE family transcriptional regulator [Campylobacter sp. 7477a]|uniref:XRE family transcriptional regulator n=1 Tax=Campylobacter sp. 7477a TaxID=2735741 RepID=UPI00301473F7|nr:LexA family transcriptional regulator [Campylobacter sp. 7477a]
MVLGKKIRLVREEQGLNQSELADKLSITSRTLQNYEYGTSIPDIKLMQKMAQIFQVPIGYFLDDNFDVNSIKNDVSLKKAEKLQHLKNTIGEQENRLVNLRFFPSVSAAAGYGANNDDDTHETISVTANFLTKIWHVPVKQYDVIRVAGDSMEPFLKDGDMVLVLPTHEASNGEIVIANLDGDLYVKKMLKDPIKKRVRLTSMNELYEDIIVEGDELEQLKIVGIVKKVLPSGVISA